uniref:Putative secreted protein n=1 Tax=Amblyomma cajennense TaxID=34607 RepID=A0A023FF96_AMBCJ
MPPTTVALSLLILAVVCLAASDQRGDRVDCPSSGCAKEERELAADNHGGTNAAHETEGAPLRSPTAAASRQARSSAHDSHQQDSSSPLLKVNFWLTLLISALAAALLS